MHTHDTRHSSTLHIRAADQRAGHHSPDQRGQATTEYALILLVAAVIAMLAIGWATAGGGAGKIGGLFDALLQGIIDRASSEL